MRDVLVLIHDDVGQQSRLQAAFDLVRASQGKLLCVDLAEPDAKGARATRGGSLVMEAEVAPLATVRDQIEASGLSAQWIERRDAMLPALSETAALADLIVMSAPRADLFPPTYAAISELLVTADTPIVAVPPESPGICLNGEVLICWDGSREAHHAMVSAIPLLRRASTVTIVEIDDGSLKLPASQAQTLLAQRNIASHVRSDLAFGEKAAFVILEQIDLLKADYVVMGGFGHSRLVENIFGGVTERLLHESPVPLFLKH
ncbi:universal stress protein [Sphingomonas mali]|uniref:universal stress protein n=1 Tax=Sphingomonas mali TaxID=40682 RepID=UPI001471866E|nr:universal stress protein [Sphingomonas mali]